MDAEVRVIHYVTEEEKQAIIDLVADHLRWNAYMGRNPLEELLDRWGVVRNSLTVAASGTTFGTVGGEVFIPLRKS